MPDYSTFILNSTDIIGQAIGIGMLFGGVSAFAGLMVHWAVKIFKEVAS